MSRADRASPGGSIACSDRCTVRSAFVNVPVFSSCVAAGSTTSAIAAVSVRKRSCTTVKTSSDAQTERTRSASGSDTSGFVALTHQNGSVPCSM
jgi:hypothetical protein